MWHSDIYPTETTLKNTLMAELKLDVGDPVETARFDKAWDGFLCKEFTTNFNDRRNALGDAFKRYILHENNCTVDDRREGDEECVAELKEQLLEGKSVSLMNKMCHLISNRFGLFWHNHK